MNSEKEKKKSRRMLHEIMATHGRYPWSPDPFSFSWLSSCMSISFTVGVGGANGWLWYHPTSDKLADSINWAIRISVVWFDWPSWNWFKNGYASLMTNAGENNKRRLKIRRKNRERNGFLLLVLVSHVPPRYPTTSQRTREQWQSITTSADALSDTRNGCSLPMAAKAVVSTSKCGFLAIERIVHLFLMAEFCLRSEKTDSILDRLPSVSCLTICRSMCLSRTSGSSGSSISWPIPLLLVVVHPSMADGSLLACPKRLFRIHWFL